MIEKSKMKMFQSPEVQGFIEHLLSELSMNSNSFLNPNEYSCLNTKLLAQLDKAQRAMQIAGLMQNKYGVYCVKICPPISLRVAGVAKCEYIMSLKTDIPSIAKGRAFEVKQSVRAFFNQYSDSIEGGLSFSHRLRVVMFKHGFEPNYIQPTNTYDDSSLLGDQDFTNALDNEAIPFIYNQCLSKVVLERLASQASAYNTLKVGARVHHFLNFLHGHLIKSDYYCQILIRHIYLYQRNLIELQFSPKECKKHMDAVRFFFKHLNRLGYSSLNLKHINLNSYTKLR